MSEANAVLDQAPNDVRTEAEGAKVTIAETLTATPSATPTERREKPVYSRPAYIQKLTLNSLQAQRVVERSFSRVSYSLFSLDVILQIIGEREEVDQVEAIIREQIANAKEELDRQTAQLQKLLEDNGVDEIPPYTNPVIQEIEISSPQVAQFASLIRKLDTMIGLMDALWLNSILSSKQRADAAQQWQQHLNKLASRIIGVEKRARVSAHTKGKQGEVDEAVPAMESDDDQAVEENQVDDAEATAAKTEKPKAAAKASKKEVAETAASS